ncbi:hypothetical protein FBEOM_10852 [Fusarium beomiforme]|uniref:non-specific serine/threonine protein kinase n=1 Tax=Fusarium beomiforme TaxID=44412 RepID=A0A9P5DTX5_9HYPO|nr:hypothetical protein FBEOM_10852 [Fusarium beomiforme]
MWTRLVNHQRKIKDDIPPPRDGVKILNKDDKNKDPSVNYITGNQAKPQSDNLKQQQSSASSIQPISRPNVLPPRELLAKLDQALMSNFDGSTLADSLEWEGNSQIVVQADLFPGEDDYLCKDGISKAPENLSLEDVYLKKPNLIVWDAENSNPSSIADLVLQEAEICETLKQHPNPNIVRYFGCLVEDDRIEGLVLGKYTSKLSDKLADSDPAERMRPYEGVDRGVRHLHKIELIHNDLKPANIMADGNIPVIIDFDSCRHEGEKLGEKSGTSGWDLEEAEFPLPENDFHSLEKLKEYILSGAKAAFH